MSSARELVDRLTAELMPLEIAVAEAWWETNVASSPDADARRIALEQELSDRYADPDVYAQLCAAGEELERAAGSADPVIARAIEVYRRDYAGNQLPVELRSELVRLGAECDTVYATFRGEAGGRQWTDNDIETVLGESDDIAERTAAWEASKQVGAEVAARVRRLVELRNEAARSLGYPHYYRMALDLGELDEAEVFGVLDELDRLTAAPFAEMKAALDEKLAARFGVGVDELGPWAYADPFFQEAPREAAIDLDPLLRDCDLTDVTLRTYDAIGIDIRPALERSDLVGRPGKNQHAFCLTVDRADDVRVLCNNIANERWAGTMLHEFGHAAYDLGVDRDLPWVLRRPAHSFTTEAVAQLFGRLTKDAGWLRQVAEVPEEQIEGVAAAVQDMLRSSMLIFARWVLVMCHFERDLYADEQLDADQHWWDLVERFQLIRRPAGRSAPDWAAKLHIALAPVYYQNYVLGECLASQLAETARARGGTIDDRAVYGDPATGAWLTEKVFAPGASRRWDALVEDATGAPLSAGAFVREFVEARP